MMIIIVNICASHTKRYTYDFEYESLESMAGSISNITEPNYICTSLSGRIAIASDTNGNIYRTKNHGKSWTSSKALEINKNKYGSISGCVFSKSGEEILISTNDDDAIFYSNDFGDSFTIQSSRTCSIMSASDGLNNVVCINGTPGENNAILYSNDKGKTWIKSKVEKAAWIGVASNSDFTNIVAIVQTSENYAYGSSDGGKTFEVIANNEDHTWSCLAASRDLETMIITDSGSRNAHYSVDGGYNWKQLYNGIGMTATYKSCAVSGDGKSFALGWDNHAIEIGHDCEISSDHSHCHSSWKDQLHGSSTGSFDTVAVALNDDGTIFYAVDATAMEIEIGTVNE